MSDKTVIDIWADVLCPWCYLGEKRLETAVKNFSNEADIKLNLHTFILDPTATKEVQPTLEYISKKLGVPVDQARQMEETMAIHAAQEGLVYKVDRPQSNTFDMLRLIQLGKEYNVEWEYLRAMQVEVFSGNEAAFEHTTLIKLGEGLGIPTKELQQVLSTDKFADVVHKEHSQAVQYGARGVPFTVVNNRIAIPGAVSTAQYIEVLKNEIDKVK